MCAGKIKNYVWAEKCILILKHTSFLYIFWVLCVCVCEGGMCLRIY